MENQTRRIALKNKDGEVVDYAIIDEGDFPEVNKLIWRKSGNYAITSIKRKVVRMNQFIMGDPPEGFDKILYLDNNPMNNTRENLRFATNAQVIQRTTRTRTTSQYLGVTWNDNANKWVAWSSTIYLGSFKEERDAAIKYDTYTLLKYGRNANTNGLVNYEDIKDVDIESLRSKRPPRDLPKHIFHKRNSFEVQLTHDNKQYRSIVPTLDEAKARLAEYKKEIEGIERAKQEEHAQKPILRNAQGVAVISVNNGDDRIEVMVSDDKWHDLMKYKWWNLHQYYTTTIDNKLVRMHRHIVDAAPDDIIDHINGNREDNRTENLRKSTFTYNNHNRKKSDAATSKYHGVCFNKKQNKWRVEIRKDNVRYNVGSFNDENEAALAYNEKARELYGNFAVLNVVE
jgi:hypothetical protein